MRNSLDHLRTHIHTGGGGVEKRSAGKPALLAATDSVTLLLCRVTAPPNIHANLWDHAVQARRHSRCVPVIAALLFFFPCRSAEWTAHCELCAANCEPLAAEANQGQRQWEEYPCSKQSRFSVEIDDVSHHLILTRSGADVDELKAR